MNSNTDGWHNAYTKARQIEADNHLPTGSIKPEINGKYSLIFIHLNEEQIKQLSHLWYVISQTQHFTESPKLTADSAGS